MRVRFVQLPLLFLASLLATGALSAREQTPIVSYAPGLTIVEGDQPLSTTFVLSITSPSNVSSANPVSMTPLVTILSKPADVADNIALSYITLTPPTLLFTGPGQTLTTVVNAHFPEGTIAGEYAYKIITPGWAAGTQDGGAFINATVFPVRRGEPPTVDITTPFDGQTFTYQPLVGPLQVPVSFTSSAPLISPITTIDAGINGVSLSLTNVSNGDGSFTSTGTRTITAAGLYTLRARATNSLGTGTDSIEFNVVIDAPPPTASISLPATGSSYTLPFAGPVSVPYSFAGQSAYGNISILSATLNGQNVTYTPTGLGTLSATGTGNFSISASGNYELIVTASSPYGTATARTTFTVNPPLPPPPPTVTIAQPVNGTTFTRVVGSAPTQIPFSYTGSTTPGFAITSLTATLNGAPVTASVTGLNSVSATGTGSFSISTPGTYTLNVTAASGSATATTSSTFTVTETAQPTPAPTVTIAQPVNGTTFTRLAGSAPTQIPFSYTGSTTPGFTIDSLTATLNGAPVTASVTGLGSVSATGTGNFSISTPGTYTLNVTATSGSASATTSSTFTVAEAAPPPPTVAIAQPVNGSTFTRVVGSAPTQIPFSYTGSTTTGFAIDSLTATLNGAPVTASVTGLGSVSATGTGNFSISTPGTYTLNVTATSGSASATTLSTFTVTETTPPTPGCTVNWLPPISLGRVQKSGSNVAIKFELYCECETGIDRNGDGDPDFFPGQRTKSKTKIDRTVVVAVSELFANNTAGAPMLFVWDTGSPNVPTYTIQGNDMYHLNFPAPKGAKRYRIEVFQFPAGSTAPRVLGTREFTTK